VAIIEDLMAGTDHIYESRYDYLRTRTRLPIHKEGLMGEPEHTNSVYRRVCKASPLIQIKPRKETGFIKCSFEDASGSTRAARGCRVEIDHAPSRTCFRYCLSGACLL